MVRPGGGGQTICARLSPQGRAPSLGPMAAQLLSYLPPDLARALAGYPPWLVVAGAVVAAVVGLWLLGKLLKLALYASLVVLILAVAGCALWWVLGSIHGVPGPVH